jgi:nitrogen-specific signal transduction histidine kinase/CheY-like chemotaxis protein
MRRTGERFPAQLLVSRVAYDQTSGWISYIIDISARKASEAALAEIKQASLFGALAGKVAHDLNNMLSVIGLNNALVAKHSGFDLSRFVGAIDNATNRCRILSKSLLTAAQRGILDAKLIDLRSFVEGYHFRNALEDRADIHFLVINSTKPIWVKTDPDVLADCVLELLNNAKEAIPSGGTIEIRLLSTECGPFNEQFAVLQVADNGPGMSDDTRKRSLEPFFTTKGGIGTGLGLAKVQGFALSSGGRIDINSQLGRGTEVKLYLPTSSAPALTPTEPTPRIKLITAYRVLIVDDEPELLLALEELLAEHGYSTEAVRNADAALAALAINTFDIMLTDVAMTEKSGVNLAKEAMALAPGMRIVFMSGFNVDWDDACQLWPIIGKPFDLKDLLTIFNKLLN